MLVGSTTTGLALSLRQLDRHDLGLEEAGRLGAAAQRCWRAQREARPGPRGAMPKSAATFSAVCGIESTPNAAFICGLTKRQPIVVS